MATKKAGGTARNISYNNPQYLGVKLYSGEKARIGNVIIRQRGTKFVVGKNTARGKDDTIFAMKDGVVQYRSVRRTKFDGRIVRRQAVDVV